MIRSPSMSWPTLLLPLALLGACDGGSDGGPAGGEGEDRSTIGDASVAMPTEPVLADPAFGIPVDPPAPLLVIEADPERIAAVPTLVAVETLADSGLQVGYTEPSQRGRIEPLHVGVQWEHMQRCVGVVAPPPLVLVRVDVEPFAVTDDVIRDIEGRISASASEPVDGVAILQVRDAPFDGSTADAGFGLLRQIMGRHLWLSAGLLERFYPSECARTVPTGSARAATTFVAARRSG